MKSLLIVDFDQIGLTEVQANEPLYNHVLLVRGSSSKAKTYEPKDLKVLNPEKYSIEVSMSPTKNAADFVIASEATRLLSDFDYIQIASSDKGLDAICLHLNKMKKALVTRYPWCSTPSGSNSLPEFPSQFSTSIKTLSFEAGDSFEQIYPKIKSCLLDNIRVAVAHKNPPKSSTRLLNYLVSLAKIKLSDEKITLKVCNQLISELSESGFIRIKGSKLFYKQNSF